MVEIAIMAANVQGDIGGVGISRMHFQRQDATTPLQADCVSAMTAWGVLWNAAKSYVPAGVNWTWQSQVTLIEHDSAQLFSYVNVPSPPTQMTGLGAGNYAAGNGCRIDWLTSSLHGRRFMRAANFMVPLASAAFDATGKVASAFVNSLGAACSTFLTSMNTAGLELVAYGRPLKGAVTGGHVGLVSAYRIPTSPATLRSRRT
jgi:hypothetical protein